MIAIPSDASPTVNTAPLMAPPPPMPQANPTASAIIDRFPAFASMLRIPEIADLIQQASDPNNQWSQDYFQEQLWNTNWWKQTPETARNWEQLKLVDPASASQKAAAAGTAVHSLALSLGVPLTPAQVTWLTEASIGQGWDQNQLTQQIVSNARRGKLQAGSIRATQDQLRSTAADYGVPVGDKTLYDWASRIQTGRGTTQGFEDYTRMHAKAAFPSLQKEIDAGFTVRQIADPYIQTASNLLGINPDAVSLSDPKWQRALQSRDAKGNIQGPMTTLDWQRTVMTDPTYGYDHSQHAIGAAFQMKQSLSRDFGLTGA